MTSLIASSPLISTTTKFPVALSLDRSDLLELPTFKVAWSDSLTAFASEEYWWVDGTIWEKAVVSGTDATRDGYRSYPAANVLLLLNFSPNFQSSSGAGMPRTIARKPNRLLPQPRPNARYM